MSDSLSRLSGLPPVLFLESPSSWFSRAALSQGIGVGDLLRHVGIAGCSDVDVQFFRNERAVLAACGLGQEDFALARAVFQALVAIDELHRTEIRMRPNLVNKRGRYRFCPLCLRELSTPYFSIHARLEIWRYCPKHWCLLETACPNCSRLVTLPFDMIQPSWMGTGIAYLGQCSRCGRSIAAAEPLRIPGGSDLLTAWDWKELDERRSAYARLHEVMNGLLPTETACGTGLGTQLGSLDGPGAFEALWCSKGRAVLTDRHVRLSFLQSVALLPLQPRRMSTLWFRREIRKQQGALKSAEVEQGT